MVHIITDSAADLEPREYKALGVTCIPLGVAFGDAEYRDNLELSKERFYELLLGGGEFPKPLADLSGKPVRLEFTMQDADLYSFRFVENVKIC